VNEPRGRDVPSVDESVECAGDGKRNERGGCSTARTEGRDGVKIESAAEGEGGEGGRCRTAREVDEKDGFERRM
jgi:hypothetical protein